MAETQKPLLIYQFHVMLRGINPAVWRRLLVRSTIADLHHTLQIAFHWSDFHLHRFLIRGQEYGITRAGCTGFTTDPKQVSLADFGFRERERFLYGYDFSDLWQHQIRFETTRPLETRKTHPVCTSGAHAAPLEDCGGPPAYMELLDQHRLHWPHEELLLVAETLSRLLDAKDDESIRASTGDLDELQEAVSRLEAYQRFHPDSFDRPADEQDLFDTHQCSFHFEREGVLRFTSQEKGSEQQTAWAQIIRLIDVEGGTASKALGWMHDGGIITYRSDEDGANIQIIFELDELGRFIRRTI